MVVRKRYEDELNTNWDGPACTAVLDYLESRGHRAVRNKDPYGVDLIVFFDLGKKSQHIEVEVRRAWKDFRPFPEAWSPVHILERKLKYWQPDQLVPTDLWVLNSLFNRALIVPDRIIRQFLAARTGMREIPNAMVGSGEIALGIPLNLCVDVDIRLMDSESNAD